MLADNPWQFVRGGAPVLILAAIAGALLGLLPWATSFIPPTIALVFNIVAEFVLTMLWIVQVAGLVQKYHQLGYFPSLRPMLASKRKDNRASALEFWKADWKQAARSTLHLFGLMVTQVRHWGSLLAILIVGGMVAFLFSLVTGMPYLVCSFSKMAGTTAELMGDTTNFPPLQPLLAALAGILAEVMSFLFGLFLLLPLAFFGGSLKKEKADKEQARLMTESVG